MAEILHKFTTKQLRTYKFCISVTQYAYLVAVYIFLQVDVKGFKSINVTSNWPLSKLSKYLDSVCCITRDLEPNT